MKQPDDERIWLAALRRGEVTALRWAYEAYGEKMLNLAYRMLGRREDAEDAVQDVWLKLPAVAAGFQGNSAFGTWLYSIMRNQCLMRLESESNRRRLLNESLSEPTPEGRDKLEDSDLLEHLLARLEPEEKALLWLKEADGLGIRELAAIFDAPEGTVKARLSRIRERLRRVFEEVGYG